METSILIRTLQNCVKQYIVHNKIETKEPEVINTRFKESKDRYVKRINEVVQKDLEAASFGIPTKKLTVLQKSAGEVSLMHGLTLWAKYLVTGEETITEIN